MDERRKAFDAAVTDPELIRAACVAIGQELVSLRDSRMSLVGSCTGLVIGERDGSRSEIVRMTIATAMEIGLKAMARSLAAAEEERAG